MRRFLTGFLCVILALGMAFSAAAEPVRGAVRFSEDGREQLGQPLAGLKIDPCLPHEMDGFTLRRVWRGATYEITVDNTAHAEKGVASMTANGQPVPTNTLSPAPAGTTVQVKVVMG